MSKESLKSVDIQERQKNFEHRFPMEMGILRLGGVYPGEVREGKRAINPYTGKLDVGPDGRVEYFGNIGEHSIAVATAAERIAQKVLPKGSSDLREIISRALIEDSTKGFEIMRKKAKKAEATTDPNVLNPYSDTAYDAVKPYLIAMGATPDVVDYMAKAGSETGHNSLKNFVTLDKNDEPTLNTKRSMAEMIVHLADDMTHTPIFVAGEHAPTTYLPVEDRMAASDFPNRYPFLYKEGFGFNLAGEVVLVENAVESDLELKHVRTYAEWQVWTAKEIAKYLVGDKVPADESEIFLQYTAIAGEGLANERAIVQASSKENALAVLSGEEERNRLQVVVYSSVIEDQILPGDSDFSTEVCATFTNDEEAEKIGKAMNFSSEKIRPYKEEKGGFVRIDGFPQLTIEVSARSYQAAHERRSSLERSFTKKVDYAMFKISQEAS